MISKFKQSDIELTINLDRRENRPADRHIQSSILAGINAILQHAVFTIIFLPVFRFKGTLMCSYPDWRKVEANAKSIKDPSPLRPLTNWARPLILYFLLLNSIHDCYPKHYFCQWNTRWYGCYFKTNINRAICGWKKFCFP